MKITIEKLEGESVWHVAVDDHHYTKACSTELQRAADGAVRIAETLSGIRKEGAAIHTAYCPLGLNHK